MFDFSVKQDFFQKGINTNQATQTNPVKNAGLGKTASLKPCADTFEKQEALVSEVKENELDSLYDSVGQLAQTVKILDDLGCPALKSVASSAFYKADSVLKNVGNVLKRYDAEIAQISNNKNLTEEEIKSKIEFIENKKAAVIQEAEAKCSALEKISDCLVDLAPMFLQLQSMGVPTSELTNMMTELVNGVSQSCSSFDKSKNKDEIKIQMDKNMKEIFGQGSADKLKNFDKELDKKVEANKAKMNKSGIQPEEKEKLKLENEVYAMQKKLFESFFRQITE